MMNDVDDEIQLPYRQIKKSKTQVQISNSTFQNNHDQNLIDNKMMKSNTKELRVDNEYFEKIQSKRNEIFKQRKDQRMSSTSSQNELKKAQAFYISRRLSNLFEPQNRDNTLCQLQSTLNNSNQKYTKKQQSLDFSRFKKNDIIKSQTDLLNRDRKLVQKQELQDQLCSYEQNQKQFQNNNLTPTNQNTLSYQQILSCYSNNINKSSLSPRQSINSTSNKINHSFSKFKSINSLPQISSQYTPKQQTLVNRKEVQSFSTMQELFQNAKKDSQVNLKQETLSYIKEESLVNIKEESLVNIQEESLTNIQESQQNIDQNQKLLFTPIKTNDIQQECFFEIKDKLYQLKRQLQDRIDEELLNEESPMLILLKNKGYNITSIAFYFQKLIENTIQNYKYESTQTNTNMKINSNQQYNIFQRRFSMKYQKELGNNMHQSINNTKNYSICNLMNQSKSLMNFSFDKDQQSQSTTIQSSIFSKSSKKQATPQTTSHRMSIFKIRTDESLSHIPSLAFPTYSNEKLASSHRFNTNSDYSSTQMHSFT